MSDKEDEEKRLYPGVNLAYELALGSYSFAQTRLDIMDVRLQTLLAFGATISLGVPAIAISKNVHLNSLWFILGVGFFSLAVIVGTYARATGYMKVTVPKELSGEWIKAGESEFKTSDYRRMRSCPSTLLRD